MLMIADIVRIWWMDCLCIMNNALDPAMYLLSLGKVFKRGRLGLANTNGIIKYMMGLGELDALWKLNDINPVI